MDRYKRYIPNCSCNNIREVRADNGGCGNNPQGYPLAMPVMPIQEFKELFSPCEAFEKGTLFAELYKPYCMRGGCR